MLSLRSGLLGAVVGVAAACGGKAVIDGQPAAGGSGGTTATTTDAVVVSSVSSSTGSGMYELECRENADCQIYDGCCGCWGTPLGVDPEPGCDIDCDQGICSAQEIPLQAICVRGQCTTVISCGQPSPDCPNGGPICASGLVPGLEGQCSRYCIPPTECTGGLLPLSCPAGTFSVEGEFGAHCLPNPEPGVCPAGINCDCVGSVVCEPGEVCKELFNEAAITCEKGG